MRRTCNKESFYACGSLDNYRPFTVFIKPYFDFIFSYWLEIINPLVNYFIPDSIFVNYLFEFEKHLAIA